MTARFAKRAVRDIAKISKQIAERSPASAAKVVAAIERAISACADFPRIAPQTDVPTLHRSAVGRYRYTIFYRTLTQTRDIEVVCVVHSSRVKNLRKLPSKE